MRLLPIALLLLMLPGIALAQEVPPEAEKDLWCGTAFMLLTSEAPGDASREQLQTAATFSTAGAHLIDRALPIYLEAGYSDEALADLREELTAEIRPTIKGGGGTGKPRFSFEDCSTLIGR